MKDPEYISELGPENSIHSVQIFAEMLGAACHPEFFNNSDVEVHTASLSPYSFPLISPPLVSFFDAEMRVFVVDIIDAVEEVLDDCLSRLPMWVVYRFYGRN